MNTRKDRLKEVYDHLRKFYGVHTKKDLAEAVEQTLPAMYSAFGGKEEYLTDSLFKRICSKYRDTFDLNYLLTGKGQLLTIEEEVKSNDTEKGHEIPGYVQKLVDQATKMCKQAEDSELRASKAEARADMLGEQLSTALADNKLLRDDLKNAIATIEGMKQQLAMVLHLFQKDDSIPQFYGNIVNDQAINAENQK